MFHSKNFRQQIYKSEKKSDEKSSTTQWIRSNMENLKVPIFSPTIFKPLVLISALVCLQQCSGKTRKMENFMFWTVIQAINPNPINLVLSGQSFCSDLLWVDIIKVKIIKSYFCFLKSFGNPPSNTDGLGRWQTLLIFSQTINIFCQLIITFALLTSDY